MLRRVTWHHTRGCYQKISRIRSNSATPTCGPPLRPTALPPPSGAGSGPSTPRARRWRARPRPPTRRPRRPRWAAWSWHPDGETTNHKGFSNCYTVSSTVVKYSCFCTQSEQASRYCALRPARTRPDQGARDARHQHSTCRRRQRARPRATPAAQGARAGGGGAGSLSWRGTIRGTIRIIACPAAVHPFRASTRRIDLVQEGRVVAVLGYPTILGSGFLLKQARRPTADSRAVAGRRE